MWQGGDGAEQGMGLADVVWKEFEKDVNVILAVFHLILLVGNFNETELYG